MGINNQDCIDAINVVAGTPRARLTNHDHRRDLQNEER